MMKRVLPPLLLLIFCTIPVVQGAEVTYSPQVEHLNLRVGEEYSFTVNLNNTETYPLTIALDNEIDNFVISCRPPQVTLDPGEKGSVEITLKPLGPIGEFERIIGIMFETGGAKIGVIGVKIKGIVVEKEAVPTGGVSLIPVLIVVLIALVAVIVWLLKRRGG